MKHLVIKNLGPILSADLELMKINVIVGPQSSGKSCVLKTASYCTWVEKRIELAQNAEQFVKADAFINKLISYHRLQGYVRENTYIEYESDFMRFSYDAGEKQFHFEWKDKRWEYSRSRVTYIPAERNMVSVIPNWFDVNLAEDNIRNFMSDWETARQSTTEGVEVLNLGVNYHYEPYSRKDKVTVSESVELDLKNTSSGLQSLIPLFVYLNYMDKQLYKQEEYESVNKIKEKENLANVIYNERFKDQVKEDAKEVVWVDKEPQTIVVAKKIGSNIYFFTNNEAANEFEKMCRRYTNNNGCNIFLEEPELNLFPPTQTRLIDWLTDKIDGEYPGTLFISTHSPYVVTSFLEKQRNDIGLLVTNTPHPEGTVVKTVSEEEKQTIYDCGVDVFFNHELFSEE